MADLWRPEVQTQPRAELVALQEERLRALVARIFERPIGLFRDALTEAGIGPGDVRTLDDLAKVPRTTKDDLRASEAEHPPLGTYRGSTAADSVRVSASTGTTGRPTITLFTAHDLEVEYEAAARNFHRLGYRPGQIIAHAHPGGLNGGQALLGGAIEYFGCLNVAVGPPASKADAERAIRLFAELKPDHYEMFGPVLHTFWETAIDLGFDPARDLNLKPPAETPPYRTVSAGLECFAFLGSACSFDAGAHVCEDEAIVECVDPDTGLPLPDGHRGNLVVTTLTKDNAMLRYDLQDVVRLERGSCSCGETHLRAFWEGRRADIVHAGDREILPNDVWVVLARIPAVAEPAVEFQIVRSADTSALRVRVEAASPADAVAAEVTDALTDRLGVSVEVTMLGAGALPRPFYKPLRVVDE